MINSVNRDLLSNRIALTVVFDLESKFSSCSVCRGVTLAVGGVIIE